MACAYRPVPVPVPCTKQHTSRALTFTFLNEAQLTQSHRIAYGLCDTRQPLLRSTARPLTCASSLLASSSRLPTHHSTTGRAPFLGPTCSPPSPCDKPAARRNGGRRGSRPILRHRDAPRILPGQQSRRQEKVNSKRQDRKASNMASQND